MISERLFPAEPSTNWEITWLDKISVDFREKRKVNAAKVTD